MLLIDHNLFHSLKAVLLDTVKVENKLSYGNNGLCRGMAERKQMPCQRLSLQIDINRPFVVHTAMS